MPTADYFSILGLAPGQYSSQEVTRRFRALRWRLVQELDGANASAAEAQLDDLYVAHAVLRDTRMQADYLHALRTGFDDRREFRRRISASLEDGLLRHTRRRRLITEGRSRGLSDFQTQLLIAQAQFGDETLDLPTGRPAREPEIDTSRLAGRLTAAGVLALGLFLAFQRWIGG